ncbi:type III polyketide synthase [Domibacillus epiphyticus]|uniref:Type III polyketide synthase n=1 Tax=Domibacillus epiphyticus TaxID=1714355 RepID=A0A1V2A4X5_9BACI|nr:3-oxoacyl-[acyl-carrier-protein] synthase III C-terminal domain-containing protein [Domibacillus epiphyticus]OMP66049.1 type III polyketide synthase [Domibacillus epiphyticus]
MPKIVSVSTVRLPNKLKQEKTMEFARNLFKDDFQDIERLLSVFQNGEIKTRHFSMPLEWYEREHSLQERNDLYIKLATEYGIKAVENCLRNARFLQQPVAFKEIDAIFFISSSGMATPGIEARIMNRLPFSADTKRIPIWGLGCAGGAAGVSRAYEYCLAFPESKVLVISIELCSLTFQRNDRSKSNLIGTSLFADGAACALITGDHANVQTNRLTPSILKGESKLLPDSENVMGWDMKDSGLHVIFSRDIPSIIRNWLGGFVEGFLQKEHLSMKDIAHFVAHPGGKKVLDAYEDTLFLSNEKTEHARNVLSEFGNMSSPTVLYVLERFMVNEVHSEDYGLMAALGPGFCGELVLLKWKGEE